jgi:hypothetical protein
MASVCDGIVTTARALSSGPGEDKIPSVPRTSPLHTYPLEGILPAMENGAADDDSCPLCQREDAEIIQTNPELDWAVWRCGSCGRFKLWTRCVSRMDGDVHVLRSLATERRLRDQSPLVIRPDTVDDLIAQGPRHPVEQGERLLVNLAHRSSEPTLETSLSTSEARALSFARTPARAKDGSTSSSTRASSNTTGSPTKNRTT